MTFGARSCLLNFGPLLAAVVDFAAGLVAGEVTVLFFNGLDAHFFSGLDDDSLTLLFGAPLLGLVGISGPELRVGDSFHGCNIREALAEIIFE